jgi:predicted TIM-barrel fold metal-dependent hydrolase
MTTAYGTANLYRHDSLAVLAGLLAELSEAAPVVALHGGGHRFVELVLLAETFPNLLIDLSCSLLYYRESSLQTDWIWGMKRLGETRFVFGSDEPFASREDSLNLFKDLMRAAGWGPAEQGRALCENARRVFPQRTMKVGREL